MAKYIIIGGVAGGATAAARLRRLDEKSEIIMFERGGYISFANCGLPYYIGDTITEKPALTLQTPASFKRRFNIDVRIYSEVVSIDRENKTVTVNDLQNKTQYFEPYDKIVLSPGAEPLKPGIEGIESGRVFTVRNIPDTFRIKDFINENKPESAVIIGGGYIGVEMAENLHKLGIKVTIVEFADHVIASLDYDTACDVHNHIRQKGVNLILSDKVEAIKENGDKLTVITSKTQIETDMALLAAGVRPESSLARKTGLNVNKKGEIVVDDYMRTSDENIYAVGDAVEITEFVSKEKRHIPLAGPANKQGRIAADNICGIKSVYRGSQGTGILKCFDLTVAMTGLTENRAKMTGLNYEKSYTYSPSHASYYPGAVNMAVKIVFDKENGRLYGAQITGYDGVDKRIDVLSTAISAQMTVYDLAALDLAYAPPYSSAKDPVNMAGFVGENILTKKTKIFHWHDIEGLKDKDVTLLDVRTEMEFENGSVEGFINIPLDKLRDNLDKISKDKPVYVMCQIGLRGHIACRILSGNGYDCYNLSGGYRLYSSIYGKQPPVKREVKMNTETMLLKNAKTVTVDACGIQCPGPVMRLSEAVKNSNDGDIIEIKTTDPAFSADVEAWCKRTGNTFGSVTGDKGVFTAVIKKGGGVQNSCVNAGNNKNIIVFSGDLDKAIASFIIANAAASMGRKVSMFFTFWGLNILRKPKKTKVKKDFLSRMFGAMMPRGANKLKISKMNMGGMGTKMIKGVMKKKNVDSLEMLIKQAMDNGVELIACTMSLDVMGLKMEELLDGVKPGGAALMLANAEESDMSLFI